MSKSSSVYIGIHSCCSSSHGSCTLNISCYSSGWIRSPVSASSTVLICESAIATFAWSPTSCSTPGSHIFNICVLPFLPTTLILACMHTTAHSYCNCLSQHTSKRAVCLLVCQPELTSYIWFVHQPAHVQYGQEQETWLTDLWQVTYMPAVISTELLFCNDGRGKAGGWGGGGGV